MDKENTMLDTTGLLKEDKALFESFYTEVEKYFNVKVEGDIDLPLEELELFKDYEHIGFREAIRIDEGKGEAFISIVQVKYTLVAGRAGSGTFEEFQVWAFAFLPKDFGHILIKPETFKDRLVELLQPIEINFPEDKEFCRKCYVLAKDRDKAVDLFNQDFRQEVKKLLLQDYYIEVLNNFLIIGNKKQLGNKDVSALASFVYNVSGIDY